MTENSIKQAENYRYSGVFWSDDMCFCSVGAHAQRGLQYYTILIITVNACAFGIIIIIIIIKNNNSIIITIQTTIIIS